MVITSKSEVKLRNKKYKMFFQMSKLKSVWKCLKLGFFLKSSRQQSCDWSMRKIPFGSLDDLRKHIHVSLWARSVREYFKN